MDESKANAARIYDYLLGGKNNFAADRRAADASQDSIREYNARTDHAMTLRTPEQIRDFFAGLELLPPGVVNVTSWRQQPQRPYDMTQGGFLGGIGRVKVPS